MLFKTELVKTVIRALWTYRKSIELPYNGLMNAGSSEDNFLRWYGGTSEAICKVSHILRSIEA